MVIAGMVSSVGDGSTWTGGWVGSAVGRVSSVGITVATGCGVLGAAQALKNKTKVLNKISFVFIVFSFG
jgi:hypothetical protein